jgi:hypothetical protein
MSLCVPLLMSLVVMCGGPPLLACADEPCAECCQAKSARAATPSASDSKQIELEVLIAEVASEKLDGLPVSPFSPDLGFVFGRTSEGPELCRTLSELKRQGAATFYANTKLTTVDGRPGNITSGGEFPILVPDQQGNFTVDFRSYGAKFDFVPALLDDGRVRLQLRPELSELDYGNGITLHGYAIPALKTRYLQTTVELGSEETFVVGGLFRNHEPEQTAAASDYTPPAPKLAQEKGLVVVITPHLSDACVASCSANCPACPAKAAACRDEKCCSEHGVKHADAELDCDQPQTPAVCARGVKCSVGACARDIELELEWDDAATDKAGSQADATPKVLHDVLITAPGWHPARCGDRPCCHAAATHEGSKPCCEPAEQCTEAACDKRCEHDEGCDEICCEQDAVATHCWEHMLHVRNQWESALYRASLATELAEQEAEHAVQLLDERTQHFAELQRVTESAWHAERNAIEAQHRQAVEHEQELAALRVKHLRETYESRESAMASEIRSLRDRLHSGEADRAQHARVHPSVSVVLDDKLEQVEYNMPASVKSRSQQNEIERLRREVTRLRALVEDLLCIAPESPPAPVPAKPYEEASE